MSTVTATAKDYLSARTDEADRVFDFRNDTKPRKYHVVIYETHTNKPLVWAIPNLMTNDEYHCVLEQLQKQTVFGKEVAQSLQVKEFFGDGMQGLSQELCPRLQHDYNQHKLLRSSNEDDASDQIYTVAPTWKVINLEHEQEFPAHCDGMDSQQNGGVFCLSTHSVLLEFQVVSESQSQSKQHLQEEENVTETSSLASSADDHSGATRFYYRKYPFDGPYDYCVGVHVPPGWALVMEQRPDLWYAIQPSQQQGPRYMAQTGMLQALCPGDTIESLRKGGRGAFALGPGLMDLLEDEAELCLGEVAPLEWGRHGINPKSTLWTGGRPIVEVDIDILNEMRPRRERRWTMTNHSHLQQPRQRPPRRQSLQVDPIRQQAVYVVAKGKKLANDRDDTSITADFSESNRSLEDDLMPCFAAAMEEQKSRQRRSTTIHVNRKPKRDSLVRKMMASYQTLEETDYAMEPITNDDEEEEDRDLDWAIEV